ncbi:MAG: TrmH family RNA methyltransferase [Clostridia bacterium]|nr:TrmH family RNA methyltransferase [Clostridia bacterium]
MKGIEKYKKDKDFSFSFGGFPTFELLTNNPKKVVGILTHSKLILTKEIEKILELAKQNKIEIEQNDKLIEKISPKENCFIVGVFKKYTNSINSSKQVVLVNPSDMGNLGTIMRAMLGFGITNLVIIKPAVDYFNPKVIRASMGAIFSLNITEYQSLEEYMTQNLKIEKFFFMLNGTEYLGEKSYPKQNFALVFGNEATGLPENCLTLGRSILIKHSEKIDSLNLPTSVGIALFEFNKNFVL